MQEIEEVGEVKEVEEIKEVEEEVLGIEEILEKNNNWDIEDEITITEDKEIEESLEVPHYVLSEVSTSLETLENMMIDEPSKDIPFESDESDKSVTSLYSLEDDYKVDTSEDKNFDQQQKEFLSGKTVLKDIISEDGETIVKKGDLINEEVIKTAKKKGKLIEIIMNCK